MKTKIAICVAAILTIFIATTVSANACFWVLNEPKAPKILNK